MVENKVKNAFNGIIDFLDNERIRNYGDLDNFMNRGQNNYDGLRVTLQKNQVGVYSYHIANIFEDNFPVVEVVLTPALSKSEIYVLSSNSPSPSYNSPVEFKGEKIRTLHLNHSSIEGIFSELSKLV